MQKNPLSFDRMLSHLGDYIQQISDHRKSNNTISLSDCLLGGFAMFSLKDSSLLNYVKNYKARALNLSKIYGINACPSDGAMRTILDRVSPDKVIDLYSKILSKLRTEGVSRLPKIN